MRLTRRRFAAHPLKNPEYNNSHGWHSKFEKMVTNDEERFLEGGITVRISISPLHKNVFLQTTVLQIFFCA